MLRIYSLAATLLLVAIATASAQITGRLTGHVTDDEGTPLVGATVRILGTTMGGIAKAPDARFTIAGIRAGSYEIQVSAIAHRTEKRSVRIDADRTTTLDVQLATASIESKEVVVRSTRPVVRESVGTVHSITAESLDRSAGTSDASGISLRGGRSSEGRVRTDGIATSDPFSEGFGTVSRITFDTDPKSKPAEGIEEPKQRPGQLTAGEWSDLGNWEYWREITTDSGWSSMPAHWGYDPSSRVTVRLVDGEMPVIDAEVRMLDEQGGVLWNARSDNRGRAELFAGMKGGKGPFRVEVKSNGVFIGAGRVSPGSSGAYIVKMPGASAQRDEFDLMYVVDATGSMTDEMKYIQAELESVIDRVREASSDDLKIRLSCNFYRDQTDEYVVRPFPFTESTGDMIGNLRAQSADGGGDFEEAVEEGLENAIDGHDWSTGARARLLFLVLDAPPHYTEDRLKKLHELTVRAAARGIRIIPIAASGINKETEFLLRLLDIHTGGSYLFLTDDSGIGGSHLKPTIGRFSIDYLDNLMVKVMARYLAIDRLTSEEATGMELR